MRSLLTPILTLCLAGTPMLTEAQAAPGGRPARPETQGPAAPPAPARVPAAPRPPVAEKRVGQAASIRVELLLTDKTEATVIAEERLNVVVADLELARVRRRNGPAAGQPATPLSTHRAFEIDLTPEIVGEKVKITLTLTYMAPAGANGEDETSTVALSENLTAFLENGKPTTLIESTGDQGTTRRVIVQATATILR